MVVSCCVHLLQCLRDLHDGPMSDLYTIISIYSKPVIKEKKRL